MLQPPDPMLDSMLSRIEIDRESLPRAVIERLDDSMIREIAAADYGFDSEQNEEAIRALLTKAPLVHPRQWHPCEVLELVRWSRPEDPGWKPGGHDERGHIMRAFCCIVLLHDVNYGSGGANNDVARLVESAIRLNDAMPSHALKFLNWCMREQQIEREERVFFVVGMLILLVKLRVDDSLAERLVHWIQLEDQALHESGRLADQRAVWGLTYFDLSHDIWLSLITDVLQFNEAPLNVRELARRLIDEHSRTRRER